VKQCVKRENSGSDRHRKIYIKEAYDILFESASRKKYDQLYSMYINRNHYEEITYLDPELQRVWDQFSASLNRRVSFKVSGVEKEFQNGLKKLNKQMKKNYKQFTPQELSEFDELIEKIYSAGFKLFECTYYQMSEEKFMEIKQRIRRHDVDTVNSFMGGVIFNSFADYFIEEVHLIASAYLDKVLSDIRFKDPDGILVFSFFQGFIVGAYDHQYYYSGKSYSVIKESSFGFLHLLLIPMAIFFPVFFIISQIIEPSMFTAVISMLVGYSRLIWIIYSRLQTIKKRQIKHYY
jgi:hypothetical protein